ncbi:ATP-binding protein [Actinophytocola oryzae]|uniref:Regulatory LuxR family protein n=1 Tax=Actinophytocola oryzae TaxID=502181 RepID=A0A4R7URB6_9PSEU|nr:LuxR family transcriptional regulator [Actinophytocola oryzae]TDV35933.1 regulatory LuxR family protein [Actinophytocola oryzae]
MARPGAELVGRRFELDTIDGALADVMAGSFRAVAIRGEPGVGKTLLLGELAERAGGHGLPVNRGRATEFEQNVPFGIFIDAFERLAATGAPPPELDLLTAASGGGQAELDRYRLFRGVRRLLEGQAGRRGAILVLDDLHWADPASLALTEYLLRRPPRGPVLVAVAHRVAQPPPGLADALVRLDSAAVQLAVEPLGEDDVAAMFPTQPHERRTLLHRATRGNPLYLRALAETDEETLTALARQAVDDRIVPERALLDVLGAELATLAPEPLLVAQAAAVAGDPADRDLVAYVTELPDESVAAAFDVLTRTGMTAPEGPRFRFRHPLVRAAAYWLSQPGWRVHAHGRIAHYLADRHGPLLVRAHHVERSARPGDEDAVATLAAAATATRHASPTMSARLARRALQLLSDRTEPADGVADELRILLARTLGLSGELGESRKLLHDVIQADGPHRTEAVAFCAVVYRLLGKLDEARALLTNELDRLPARGAPTAKTLLELAGVDLLCQDPAAVCRHAGEALAAAEGDHDTGLVPAAHAVLALGLLQCDESDSAGTHVDQAAWLVDAAPDAALLPELGTLGPLAWVELHLRHPERATRHIGRALELARGSGLAHTMPHLLIVDAYVRTRRGQLTEALASADEALDCAAVMNAGEAVAMAMAVRLRPTLWQHGPRAALGVAGRSGEDGRPGGGWWSGLAELGRAEVYLAAGDAQGCLAELAGESADGATASSRLALRAVASVACGLLDDGRRQAGEALRRAERSAGAHQLATAHHALARVRWAAEDPDAGTEAARTAVTRFAEAGSPVEEGIARQLLAELYASTGRLGAAREEFGRAKVLYAASAATWLSAELARDERRFAARAPRPRRSDENGLAALTTREREVVDLATAGLTNREIAERLYLSPKTVETHLSRAFAKLHVRSRVDLTRRVTGSG